MRIIDLLNNMAKGYDLPEKIVYKGNSYILDQNINSYWNYENKCWLESKIYGHVLNDYIEVVEDNKIKKLDVIEDEHFTNDELQAYIYEVEEKINEIIEVLNEMRGNNE